MEVKPGYKQTEVGVILEEWRDCDISELCLLQRGFDLTEATRKRGEIPVYSSSGLSYFHNEARLRPPAVITGRKGMLGKVFFVEEPCWPHDTTLWVKDFNGNDPRFVAMFLGQFRLERFDAATSVPTLNRNNVVGIPIKLPPLPEQCAIATALSDADAWIESLEQLIAKKRQIKQGAMQELLTGKRRLPGFSGEWVVKRLGDVGKFLKGSGVTKDQTRSGTLACVRYGELYTLHNDVVRGFQSWISPEVAATAVWLKKGDILFAGSGETKEEIGKCAAFVSDIEAYAGGDIVILRPNDSDSVFLGYYLNTGSIARQKASRGQGDAVVHISSSALSNVRCKLPSPAEQTAIATVLSEMDTEIAMLETMLTKALQIKQGMMQELLTGRIRLI
jgi:type I restriction enzyme S subunit